MPQGDTLQSIIDLPVQLSELDKLIAKVLEYKAAIIETNAAMGSYKAAGSASGPSGGSGGYASQKTEIGALIEANKKLAQTNTAVHAEVLKLKEAQRQLNAEMTAQAKDAGAAEGSLNKLRAEYIKLNLERDKLKIGSEGYTTLTAQAAKLRSEIQTQQIAVGNFSTNVGNYNDKMGTLAKSIKGLGGLGIILSKALGIDPELFANIREAGRAVRDLHHLEEGEALVNEASEHTRKISNVTLAQNTIFTQTNAEATQGAAIAETEFAAATEGATASQKALRIALMATGIGIGLLAVGLIIYEFTQLVDAAEEAKKEFKEYTDVIEQARSTTSAAASQVFLLKTNVDLAKEGFIKKNDVVKDYNDTIGKTIGKANDLNDVERLLNQNAEAYIKFTFYKAVATAAFAKAADEAVSAQEIFYEKQRLQEQAKDAPTVLGQNLSDIIDKQAGQAINKAGDKMADFLKMGQDFQKKYAELGKSMNFIMTPDDIEKKGKEAKQKGKEAKQKAIEKYNSLFDVYKIEQQRLIDVLKDGTADESRTYEERLSLLGEYKYAREQLINAEYENEKLQLNNKLAEDIKNAKGNKKDIETLETNAQEHLKAIEAKYSVEKLKVKDDYKKEEKVIIDQHLKNLWDQAQQEVDYEKWTADQIAKIRAAQLKKEEEYQKRQDEINQLKKDHRQKTEDEIEKASAAFIDAGFERQKNAIADQKALLDQQSQEEIDRITNSTLSEQEKANKIAIIQANALAQKATLDQKQKEIDYRKAMFDRGVAIFDVIKDVARAVANDAVKNKFLIPFDIAIGAAQIAAIMAHPIPKFAGGTSSSPEGLALTDELGPEGYITPSGKAFLGNDKPTLRYLERGTRIIPHDEINKMMLASMYQSTARYLEPKDTDVRDAIVWSTAQTVAAMKATNKRPVINIKNDAGFAAYIKKQVFD